MSFKLEEIAYHQLNDLDMDQLDMTVNSDAALVLPGSTDAFEAADILESSGAAVIFVKDDSENIQGAVFPNWVKSQLLYARGIKANSFADALVYIKQEGDEAVSTTGGVPSYHHEWLNLDRPNLTWCEKGKHFIDTETCPYHD